MQKVLICDPDELFRCNLRNLLEAEGFFVEEVSRPSEAAKHVLKQRFMTVIFTLQSDDLIGVQISLQ